MYFASYMYSMPVDLRFRRLRAQKVAVLVPTLRSISRETDFVSMNKSGAQTGLPTMIAAVAKITWDEYMMKVVLWRRRLLSMQILCFDSLGSVALNL